MGSPLVRSTALAALLQVAMVVVGHYSPQIAGLFALGGTAISTAGGLLCALWTGGAPSAADDAKGGAIAGGLSALIGIAVSVALGDVPPATLAYGTLFSAVGGTLGGVIGRAVRGRPQS
ncbi:MAG: hypothetical protein ACHQ2E_03920 [Gemmatimonadales bacterium]